MASEPLPRQPRQPAVADEQRFVSAGATHFFSRTYSIAVRAFGVGSIIMIIAVVSRQVYLQVAADDGFVGADQEPTATMMMRREAIHSRLQNRHIAEDAANADEVLPRARCMES